MDRTQLRNVEIMFREASAEARTVPVTVSTTFPVDRGSYLEVLAHSRDAVDLSRAPLPVIEGHDSSRTNIGLVDNLKVDGERLRGLLRMGTSSRASELWQDIQAGIVRNVSIAYQISEFTEDASGRNAKPVVTATRWTPYEVSLVSVPADPQAGLNRSISMTTTTTPSAEERASLDRERNRRADIRAVFAPFVGRRDAIGHSFRALIDELLDNPEITVDAARIRALELWAGTVDPEPAGSDSRQLPDSAYSESDQVRTTFNALSRRSERVELGRNNLVDFAAAACDAVLIRSGVPVKEPHPAVRDISRMRLSDIAEVYLRKFGRSTSGVNREQVIRQALGMRGGLIGHSTSDFPKLLENISTKALMVGFQETPATHRAWTRAGTMPDFKQGRRVTLSDFEDLELVYENGEYKYGSFGEAYATVQLAKYGKLFSISWEALVNDDTQSFTQVPRGMAQAAVRVESDLVYAILTGGTSLTMPDTVALFQASTHKNYVASGAPPSVTTLDAGFASMGTKLGPKGSHLNITPRFLIVPRALETTARAIATSTNDPAGATIAATNPFYQRIEVIADSRLDTYDPAGWYLAADPNAYDTVERVYLDGQETPVLETQDGWTTDGVSFKVKHVVGVTALDYRGLYRNDGN